MNPTILIVDDQPDIVELLKLFLERDNYRVLEAYDGMQAWEIVQSEQIDLAVIDIMMPVQDGYQLVKQIRSVYKMPIIFLSAKNQDSDKILGLGLGADDFIVKPFNPLEVVARIQAQVRRAYDFNDALPVSSAPLAALSVGRLRLHLESCALTLEGNEIELTSTEYKLLKTFMEAPGRVFTKKQLFEKVWSDPYWKDDNTVMVHISRLRDKIEEDPRQPVYIKTIRGLGYKFAKKEDFL
ncbi:response regulator transcription factor [Paenibacillus sp. YPG26]|uniref:response regulator transcription factor n=1 Tax=Paenibacillus sp. YPG26 TaxID=2878915 RepID=UPI00203EC286|nr:response regulator transcription factor [Paenibacillus sp. YPG26]USB34649.1 response regulator transcription factor [Paenibacillus sp. YPG26]